MATFYISSSGSRRSILIFHLLVLNFFPHLSVSTSLLDHSGFDPQIALLGDAHVSGNGSYVRLTSSAADSSSGLVVYKRPFKFLLSGPRKMPTFSTEFSFSFSGNGNGLSLFMGPYDFASKFVGRRQFGILSENECLGIEFVTTVDRNVGYVNDSLGAVTVTVSKVSSAELVISGGEKLKSWVDYDGNSKRLEVRLGKLADGRPYNPIIAYAIDLSKLWGENEVYVALGSSNGNFSETFLFSWRSILKIFPHWMHSLPADPHINVDEHNEGLAVHKRRFCPITVLAGVIFATGCGTLLAFVVLFLWAVFVSRHTAFPFEGDMQPVDFRYEKINVVVEKDAKCVEN